MTLTDLKTRAVSFLLSRRGDYQAVFRNPRGEKVLEDLARFCRAHKSTAHADPYIAARLDGRREVFLRIQEHLRLSDDELWRLYNSPKG